MGLNRIAYIGYITTFLVLLLAEKVLNLQYLKGLVDYLYGVAKSLNKYWYGLENTKKYITTLYNLYTCSI